MNYELTVIPKTGYLHAIVTGQNTPQNVTAYLSELLSEVRVQGCPYVLLEERLEGPRLGIADVFEITSEGSQRAIGAIRALAYIDVNASDDTMKFAELVATNRSMPVRVFSAVAEAERWLREEVNKGRTE
jgi:hypothetical protein